MRTATRSRTVDPMDKVIPINSAKERAAPRINREAAVSEVIGRGASGTETLTISLHCDAVAILSEVAAACHLKVEEVAALIIENGVDAFIADMVGGKDFFDY